MFSASRSVLPLIYFLGSLFVASGASAATSVSPSSAATSTDSMRHVIQLATHELATQLHVNADTLKLISTEPHTWNDSSLGCHKPGTMSAQVITNGYIVTIAAGNSTHRVHATDKYAVICEHNLMLHNPHRIDVPLRNLDNMISKARMDLAMKLNAKQAQIRTVSFQSIEWPDTSMNCPVAGETIESKPTKGYRIALNYAGRVYEYHTDMVRVRACPAIETE